MSPTGELLERLIFGEERGRRFTQDSPILPDVWLAYGESPGARIGLLLTPHTDVSAGHVARALRDRLAKERKLSGRPRGKTPGSRAAVAYIQGTVVAELTFEELVRVVLPMTPWWQRYVWRGSGEYFQRLEHEGVTSLADALRRFQGGDKELPLSADLLWMTRIIGAVSMSQGKSKEGAGTPLEPPSPRAVAEEVVRLVEGLAPPGPDEERLIWLVQRNRAAQPAIRRSTLAVKADAARLLFQISCSELAWAVIDSGIDATHMAFRRRSSGEERHPVPFALQNGKWRNFTRVVATYDFTRVRALLNPGALDAGTLPAVVAERLAAVAPEDEAELRTQVALLKRHLLSGREVDWNLLEPLIRIPHDGSYRPPVEGHGTHVAGILAADWDKGEDGHPMEGVCPDIELYDFRVLDDKGEGDEFSVIAALQFLRYLNATRDHLVVHGANLSLSIHHQVANYACGRTPVCDECSRVVAGGIVVVVAAGNEGHLQYQTSRGLREGYQTVSITDPGNAEDVITVGATHRYRPHEYGVSYFSSRGPTGDGRIKPDLVAPGEKVVAPLPDQTYGRRDGTSMAAPHVSGAAALLIARHRELAGRPKRIKEVLCATATDLGRERYFQGSGMVDVLRALQKV